VPYVRACALSAGLRLAAALAEMLRDEVGQKVQECLVTLIAPE
jgi:hypothetical protein